MAAFLIFFLGVFLGAFLTGCAACSGLVAAVVFATGVPAVSAAQAGTANIKVTNNNIFFMINSPFFTVKKTFATCTTFSPNKLELGVR
jgi:hypothetical protein